MTDRTKGHQALVNQIQLAAPAQFAKLFKNTVGLVQDKRTDRWIHFGLAVGSSDLIGWRSITITKEMVGRRVAVFTGIEVKTGKAEPTKDQFAFRNALAQDGGFAGIARCLDDAIIILDATL